MNPEPINAGGRVLCGLTTAFIVGLAAERLSPLSSAKWSEEVIILLLLLLCHFAFFFSPPSQITHDLSFKRRLFPLLLFVGLGYMSAQLAQPPLPAPLGLQPYLDRSQNLFLARVIKPPDYYPNKVLLPLALERVFKEGQSFPVQAGVLLTLRQFPEIPGKWSLSDRLLVKLSLQPFHNFNNLGGYNYVKNQAQRGFFARAQAADDRLLIRVAPCESSVFPPMESARKNIDRFRQKGLFWIKEHLGSDTAALYAALLLGYRHMIPGDLQEHLNRAGVTHLLAISGLHLGMVSAAVFWLISRLIRWRAPSLLQKTSDRHLGLWVAILAAAFYAILSGLALPTWRAMIMLFLFAVAFYRDQGADFPTLLAAAALIILVLWPQSLWQVPFQLSFAAMIGIFTLYPRFERFQASLDESLFRPGTKTIRKILQPFVSAFWLSLAANAMVLPLLAAHFHGISLAGFLANTLLVPLMGLLILPLGLGSLLLYSIHECPAVPFLKAGGWLLGCCRDLILWFSDSSWSFFWVGNVPLICLAGFYAGLWLVLSSWRRKNKAFGLIVLIVLMLASSMLPDGPLIRETHAGLQVTVIDVGQGSSTLLRFPNNEVMLVDGGGFFDDSFDIGRHVVAPFLWRSGIRKLDYVVLSHDHPDHRNGLQFILSHFKVGSFWENGIRDASDNSSRLSDIAYKRGIPVRQWPDFLGEHRMGPCLVRVLHPTEAYVQDRWDGRDLNNISLVLQIDYGNTHLILPGDIDQSAERFLFAQRSFPGQLLLLAPHHGSAGSNGRLLLEQLRPWGVVFACGFENRFGFPAPGVVKSYTESGTLIYRTDLHGAVQADSDGARWDIKTSVPFDN